MEQEIWKVIEDYPMYEVSNLGKVRKISSGQLLKQFLDSKGYPSVNVNDGKKTTLKVVHRIVAFAFIPNPNNRTEIDHIDGNGLNNVVSNLRWCTHSENNMNPIARKRQSESHLGKQMTTLWKPVVCISKDGTVTHYKSMSDAGKDGFGRSSIIDSIKHPDRPVRKRRWMYLSDFEKSLVNQ